MIQALLVVAVADVLRGAGPCAGTGSVDCFQWQAGAWGPCQASCQGKTGIVQSTQTRVVTCPSETCVGVKLASEQPCEVDCDPDDSGMGPYNGDKYATAGGPFKCAKTCKAELWGKDRTAGCSGTFSEGVFNYKEIAAKGLTCNDVSSIQVFGACCFLRTWTHPECRGTPVEFPEGTWWSKDLEAWGSKNDGIACVEVVGSHGEIKAALRAARELVP
mmetsp:Transcript_12713/g.30417  ORF Transcript_12713/g.30417 Transcript_12713/m.30417 type:complete len:217 (+) Transcript_12713:75-725(+)